MRIVAKVDIALVGTMIPSQRRPRRRAIRLGHAVAALMLALSVFLSGGVVSSVIGGRNGFLCVPQRLSTGYVRAAC